MFEFDTGDGLAHLRLGDDGVANGPALHAATHLPHARSHVEFEDWANHWVHRATILDEADWAYFGLTAAVAAWAVPGNMVTHVDVRREIGGAERPTAWRLRWKNGTALTVGIGARGDAQVEWPGFPPDLWR